MNVIACILKRPTRGNQFQKKGLSGKQDTGKVCKTAMTKVWFHKPICTILLFTAIFSSLLLSHAELQRLSNGANESPPIVLSLHRQIMREWRTTDRFLPAGKSDRKYKDIQGK
jgi:hypothetical protein